MTRKRRKKKCNKYSVEAAPLDPTLKLSRKRTVLLSNGTVVPPLCKQKNNDFIVIVTMQ